MFKISNKVLLSLMIIMLCHLSMGAKQDFRKLDINERKAIEERVRKHREMVDGQNPEHTLDKVRAHEEHRMNKMKEILEIRRTHLKEHAEGTRVLSDEEHKRYTRQINSFQRKVDERSGMTDRDYENMLHEMAANIRQTEL